MTTFLDYAARGRTSWWRYPVAFVLAIVLTMAIGVGLGAGLNFAGLLPPDLATRAQDASRPIGFFIINGCLFGLLLLGFVLAIRLLHGKRFGDIVGRWSWAEYGLGVAVWAMALVLACLVDFAIAPDGFRITATSATLPLAATALLALSVQTFAEEFIFRGYVTQGLLLALKRPLPASLVSGLLFGAMHIPNGAPQAVSATLFGVILAMIAIRRGGIALAAGLHMINNVFGAAIVVSGNDAFRGSPGLLTQDTPHLMWWDVAVGAAALLALAVAIYRRPAVAGPANG